jgi:ferric-dicitrate binding protein FerR (iron transport regulator)
MIHHEDRELEQRLRSLPTAGPPAETRERILRAAARSMRRRPTWKLGLAYALCLLGLLALDIGIDHAQSARLSRLIGDGRQAASATGSVRFPLAAFRERQALLLVMMEGEGRIR